MARLALTVAGQIIGGMIGGPIGAAIGGAIGSYAGGALFPEQIHGPTLTDLHLQGSSYGSPIKIAWGSVRTGGNIIWKTDLEPHESEDSDKKSGTEVTTTSYTASFDIVLCESRGEHSLGRVWINGQLKGDYRNGGSLGELPLVFYDGNDEQLPDPTEEAILGAGMVPAYRGVARVVLTDFGLTPYGNVIPQFNFELIRGETAEDHPVSLVVKNNASGFTFEDAAAGEGTNGPGIVAWPQPGSADPIRVRETFTTNVRTYDATDLSYIGSETAGVDDVWRDAVDAISPDTTLSLRYRYVGEYVYDDDATVPLYALPNFFRVDTVANNPATTNQNAIPITSTTPTLAGTFPGPYTGGGSNFCLTAGMTGTDRVQGCALTEDGSALFVFVTTAAQAAIDRAFADKWYCIVDGTVTDSGTVSPAISGFTPTGAAARNASLVVGVMFENDRRHAWVTYTNVFEITVYAIDDDGNFAPDHSHQVAVTGTYEMTGDPGVTQHLSCVYALPDGYRAGYVYGGSLWLVERSEVTAGQVLLSEIVADICERDGLTSSQYNVTDIPIPVRGYMLDRTPITGRAALEFILPAFFVDVTPDCRFVRRGMESLVTIPDEDLAARLEDEELPAKLQVVRGQDADLPSHIILNYVNADADYLIGTQQWRRMTGGSKVAVTINVPVVLTSAEAKRVVEIWGQSAWLERDDYVWYTTRKYIAYEPTDVVTVQGIDLRITKKLEGAKGVIKWEGKKARVGIYAQSGIGGESEGFVPSEIVEPQETELALLDGPFIGEDWRQGYIPVVGQGALRRSWKGMSLQKSLDGTNYSSVLTETRPGTIGETLTALGNYGGAGFDEHNVLQVLIPPGGGDLVSVSRDAAFAGENAALVGAEDDGVRGEWINFKNATLVSEDEDGKTYDITGILRGRHGSKPFMAGHAVGDKFIMLPPNSSMPLQRSDLGVTRNYKPVTLGSTLASADVYPFRSHGLPFAAYAPAFPRAGFDDDGSCWMRWNRRSRVSQGWLNFRAPTGLGPPLGEETEAYRVRIYSDGTKQTVLNTYTVEGETEFEYTTAMQTADFGSPLTVRPAWNVAQKCSVGWGWDSDGGAPIFVLSGIAGYVPPNPSPDDAIHSTLAWTAGALASSGSMTPNDRWIIQFTTGAASSTPGDRPNITVVEFGGDPPAPREWTLSLIEGDFGPQAKPGAAASGVSSITAVFCVGTDTDPFYPTIPTNTTAYLNIKNLPIYYASVGMRASLQNPP